MANLKPGWRRVKFGQLAECVNDRVDDPSKAGVDRYVGLEHLDPESLTIRRWGTPDEVESTKLRFRPGDIIFGKRRAYQRKLAVADFDGICSAHAMVLRAKSDAVLPEFLPFLMQSNLFMERAVAISVGSLSPTINWKTLAEEEFALPPMEEQRRLSMLIKSANEAHDRHQEAATAAKELFRAMLEDLLAHGTSGGTSKFIGGVRYAESWPIVPLGKIARLERGKFSHRPRNLPQFFGGRYPFIQVSDIAASVGKLVPATQFLSEEGVRHSRSFPPGTVLISITGAVIAKTAITTQEIWTTDSIVGIQPSPAVESDFIEFVLRRLHPLLNGSFATNSTTQKNINLETLRPLAVPCPPLHVQREIVAYLQQAQATIERLEARAQAGVNLRGLLAQNFLNREGVI